MSVGYGDTDATRESHQCQVGLRIVSTLTLDDSESRATVSREDEHEHVLTIEGSFRVKKLVAILAVAKEEHAITNRKHNTLMGRYPFSPSTS